MKKFEAVQAWIDSVAYSHSKNENTEYIYKYHFGEFCGFIGLSPEQILEEYESMTDRQFRRKYAQYIRAFISKQDRNGYAINSIGGAISAIKSFFKYNDLPLGYVPLAKRKVTFHNRDINKEEIVSVLKISRPRDKAFFCMMAQSGLRPDTLRNLKRKHVEPEFSKGIIPCCIEVPEEIAKGEFGAYFSFMGEESVNYLKAYLDTRATIDPEDYLFTSHGTDKRLNTKSISGIFLRAIQKLKEKGLMDFEQKQQGKPRSVRLYNLRKFFRKYGGQAGVEYVNFWMGHKTNYKAPHIPASDEHYFSREDVEFHRQLYKEKAMPHLRLETATPSETEQTIMELRKQLTERSLRERELSRRIAELEREREDQKGDMALARELVELLRDPGVLAYLKTLKKKET